MIRVAFDVTAELDDNGFTCFQELIGILRWAKEIGRVDILFEVSIPSQFQANPREGHLKQLLHVFAFLLRKRPKLAVYMSPEVPRMDFGDFRTNREDFAEICRNAEEQLPHRMPAPCGMCVTTTAFVDSSHDVRIKLRGVPIPVM
jgi:hypothetical protein